jgi:ABC-type glycerol-3-phosphate transport system substrate-binding protein
MSVPQYRKVAALALVTGLGLSLAACSTKGDDDSGKAAGGKTTITVDCQPVGAQKELLQNWNADVAQFEKDNPDISIKSVSVGEQCNNPPDFTARLAGGTMTDVFYGYMTDLQQVLDSGQAMDITSYLNKDTISTWDSVDPALKGVFTDAGKIYAVPVKNYSMGLVYNKTLFQKAGLDVNNPPKTWPEVRDAAKKISATGGGVAGYADYSAGTSPPRCSRRVGSSSALTARRPTSTTRWASRSCRTSRTCGTATTAWAPGSFCSGVTC